VLAQRPPSIRNLLSDWGRQHDAIPDGVVFIPFAYVEAAANLLTNPALDPFGKIPEFKYCAAKVERVGPDDPRRGGVVDANNSR
jgi:predicted molibdopterin-dependent oxidoreductase YjgC